MRLIDAEILKSHLKEIFIQQGYDANELHFSLMDMENNIDAEKTVFEDIDILMLNEKLNEIRSLLINPVFKDQKEKARARNDD